MSMIDRNCYECGSGPRDMATSCWCITVNIPKARIIDSNAVKFGELVGHTL